MADDASNLRVVLQRAGMSPERFARRLNAKASELQLTQRIDPKTPYKWFRGSMPRSPWPTLASAVLSAELGQTISVEDLGWTTSRSEILTVPADTGLALPWTAEGAAVAATEVTETGAMDRRIFIRLTGASLTGPALEWLLAQPSGSGDSLMGRRVQHAHIDAIEAMTDQLRRMDDQLGGGAVLDLAKNHVRYLLGVLRSHSYSNTVGNRLYGAAGELLRLSGWLSFDAGRHAQAQRYWLAALRAAHVAGDRALGANVLGFMSCQAKDLQHFDEAIKLASAARQGYSGASPQVTAILNLRVAQAYAQTGEVKLCRNAIDGAYGVLGDPPPGSGNPPWSYWLDQAQVNEQVGYCFLRLGNWGQARAHLRTALRVQAEEPSREGALRQTLLAVAYAHEGEPEHACEIAGRAVATLSGEVDSDRCVGHIRRVQEALKPYRTVGAVHDFNERVGHLLNSAAASP